MWAFSDESEWANRMLFGVAIVPVGVAHDARRQLENLLLPGQRQVHTAKESPRRRRRLLDVVAELEGLQVVVWQLRRPAGLTRIETRRLLVTAAAHDLLARQVVRWTLDDQDPAQLHRDRLVIASLVHDVDHNLVYDHQPAHSEPLLWAVDAVCWAVGKGGDWQRRIAGVIDIRDVTP